MYLRHTQKLTRAAALIVLQGAIAKAEEMQVTQSITIVDTGGNLLAFIRMDGTKFLSQMSSNHKAITAASSRVKTGDVSTDIATKLTCMIGGPIL